MDVFDMDLAQLRILGQVAVAMVLGALIGLERQLADRPAGLRTHMDGGGRSRAPRGER
ncbi:MAG: MgtC/SapB family protein [Nitrospirales bacterium]